MIYSAGTEQTPEPAPQMRAVVVVEGKRLVVPADGAVVGRSRDCDVVLADSNVSRHHARIAPAPGGWSIEDLGSTNGVRINGRQIADRQALRSGDHVEFGTVQARFEVA
jgi:pSer/pThr/pTyr-binding forkhead associated (FHA) protein